MPCYYPIKSWPSKELTANGKRKRVFSADKALHNITIDLPCGRCIGCRLERSRQWAIRMLHEASCYKNNCFLTLTYDDKNLPHDGSLYVEHFQKFMKRLRIEHPETRIRFFHCGEYGDENGRPHYHAILFNFKFKDEIHIKNSKDGLPIYTSETLDRIWKKGLCFIGTVTFESAAYVARYITKKVNGEKAEEHYARVDWATGEIYQLKPEYTTMSRKPGIGKPWLEKFQTDIYPADSVIIRGKEMKPPKFYDGQYEISDPAAFEKLKDRRIKQAKTPARKWNSTPERLKVREKIKLSKIKDHSRNPS